MDSGLSILNPQPQKLPGPSLLHELVCNGSSSNQSALDFLDREGEKHQISYQQLHDRSNALATRIHASRGDDSQRSSADRFIVPMFIGQCPSLYITQLAILKAGGAFCPIPLDAPQDRLKFILKDASASLLLTTSDLQDRLPALDDVAVISVDQEINDLSNTPPTLQLDPSMPAYVMYTSGSTGQPKGVVLSHSAATQALLAHERHIPPFSRFLQFANPTFDVSVFEIFFPLFRGKTLVCCERSRMLNDLPEVINSMRIDAAELTPSVANTLLRGRESVTDLKVLLTIGEMLKQGVVEDFGGSSEREAVLHGMYGPTEATIHCTLQPSFASDMPVGNIGFPLDTVSAFIIRPMSNANPNEAIEILPVGEEGELAVGGYQLADGYLHREEQTKAAFVPHSTYGRLYRTGDRARLDENGRLICSGRISSGQVKLRGQRIELGEIEYAASRAEGCQTAVADVISGSLVVFCVPKSSSLSKDGVLRTCQDWLPAYMTPTDVHIVESLPYLASGKVDRRALQSHHEQHRQAQPAIEAEALDEQTQRIADVFKQVLRVDVSKTTNLSSAGLDSLTAIRVASKLRGQGFGQIAATDILDARNLENVKNFVDRIESKSNEKPIDCSLLDDVRVRRLLPSEQLGSVQEIVPCTPTQVAMLSETSKDPQAYCNWIELQFDVQQSIDAVELALKRLVQSHDMLRAGFLALDNAKHPYAIVTWKPDDRPSSQRVQNREHDFTLEHESQLLRPARIQLAHSTNGVTAVLQMHHAIYDQWSIDILKADLDSLLDTGELPVKSQFSCVAAYYAARQIQTISNEELDFWQDHLREAVATTLPQLNSQKAIPTLTRTPWTPLDISTAQLREAAKVTNTSPHAVMQAAFAYLLSEYTGSTDVLYGTVFSGRQIPVTGIEHIIGPCLATLPARCDLSAARTLADLVRSVHDRNRSMLKHSETPLAGVKQAGHFAPGSTMFDTLFIWQESTVSKPNHVAEIDSADRHEFRLVLEADPSSANVAVRVTHDPGRVSPDQIAEFVRQLEAVTLHLIENSRTLVTELRSCLPRSTLSIANPQPEKHKHSEGLIAALEEVAQRMPSSTAILFGNTLSRDHTSYSSLTYAELHQRANRLAHFLIKQGVRPNDLVCIFMDKSIQFYVSVLATLKAGAGYLPLVPETPTERVASATQQANVKTCLCETNTAKTLQSGLAMSITNVDELDLVEMPQESPRLPYSGSHAAYSIFTSGSTGIPKGLVVTMDNLLGNLATLSDIYPVQPGDKMLQACSHGFDVSVFEILFAFFKGMTLCSARKDELYYDLEHSIRSFEITHLSMTPTVAALVNPSNVPSVEFLVTAGEPMTEIVHRRWAGKKLYQAYGPSETTNICTVNPAMPASHLINNIGQPLVNTSAFVINTDSRFSILPFGAAGELAFGGEQVFRGYIGKDDLNAEKIIDHPEYGRVYRSGDIGRMLPSGEILIIGRLDDQVKIRGNRVELGEINTRILSSGRVTDCTTVILGKDATTQLLASFFIPEGTPHGAFEILKRSDTLQTQAWLLQQDLENSLPAYMIPAMILPVSTLPLTGQGKLDKRRLEAAVFSGVDDGYRFGLPKPQVDQRKWNQLEQILAFELADTLNCDEEVIERTASFSALGLNSINAIVFAKKIAKRCRQHVPVSLILRNRNISRLAQSLVQQPAQERNTHTQCSSLPSEVIEHAKVCFKSDGARVAAVLPCTPLQEAMLSAGESEASAYANETTFRFFGHLERLRVALGAMVVRHPILRTRFTQTSDPEFPFVQVVLQDAALRWVELSAAEQHPGGTEADRVNFGPDRPFVVTVKAEGKYSLVTFLMHHAIYDGASMSILLNETEMLYREQNLPRAPSFEPFLLEAQKHKGTEAMTFWSSAFLDYYAKPFPLLADAQQSSSSSVRDTLAVTRDAIDAFCKRHAVSVVSIFQAAWARLLSHAQQNDDICFGDVVSGRTVPVIGVDRLLAPCFNTVPVRVHIDKARSNVDLIRVLDKQRPDIDAHQLTPLRRIQAISRTPSSHLFDSLMLVQPPPQEVDQSIWQIVSDEGLMDLPLVLELTPSDQTFELVVHHQTRYIAKDTAMQLAHAFNSSLDACIRYPLSDVRNSAEIAGDLEAGVLASTPATDDNDVPQIDGTIEDEQWTTEETLIRQAYSRFSGLDAVKIGRNTSLFRLGLDSLSAVQVAVHLRSAGLNVTVADILEQRTPVAIARNANKSENESKPAIDLNEYDKVHRSSVLPPLATGADAIESLLPCTPAQNGMLAQSLQTRGKLYVNHITYSVPQDITESALRKAWEILRQRHQALRMGFGQTEEAKCPFAAIVHRSERSTLPLRIQSTDLTNEEDISADIIDALHLPAWRLRLSKSDRTMTLSIHHALYDAESLDILLHDLSAVLHGEALASLNTIDTLLSPILTGAASSSGETESFWRESLQHATPSAFPNLSPTVITHAHLEVASWTSSMPSAELESLCRAKGCTIQAAGQAAWAILLSAYMGDPGVTFGTVFSGRSGLKRESIVFPALTTLPVFCNATKSSDEILTEMVDYNASVQRHKHAPLSDIQRFANYTEQGLFDTIFVYQKAAAGSSLTHDWRVLSQSAAVDYNLSLELHNIGTETEFTLTFKTNMIPSEHARLMIRQYDHVLSSVLKSGNANLSKASDLYCITPAREPAIPAPVELLHQFVERSASESPDQVALEFAWRLDKGVGSRKTWSYRQLNERSNQVAHLLVERGARPGNIVAVCMHKSPEASFAFIGILKAGCAFLALDPDLPEARRQFILQDSGAVLLVVDESQSDQSTKSSSPLVTLTEDALDNFPASEVDVGRIDPQNPCYCLYTSGTTGTPKGCELTHENAVQAMMSFQRLFAGRWNDKSRWLQFASYWFDVSVLEQFWSWGVGITVVGAPRDLVLDDLTSLIQTLEITHIDLTPSLARILEPEDVPSLWNGVFITGGEALKQEIIQKWGSHQVICNGYGPTEATIGVTMNPFVGPDAKPSNIGPAFDNVGSYVFAPGTMEPVLRGAVGELCVSGKLVGKGYLNREELTEKQFPTVPEFEERVYRTGDLVRQLADGSFSFIGRQDSQAKLRGQRLEIDEIDSVIKSSSDNVADVASLVVKSASGDKETLVSFIITTVRRYTQDTALDVSTESRQAVETASNACRAHLPGYMVPTHIMPLNVMPLNINNKTDAKRLAAFYASLSMADLQGLKSSKEHDKQLGEHEQRIGEVLARMLSIDASQVTRATNLFSVGLSSVSAIAFASLLKKAGFKTASVATVLRNASLGQLADVLTTHAPSDDEQNHVRQAKMSMHAFNQRYRALAASGLQLSVEDIEMVAPCTPLQQGLVLESLRDNERPYFNQFTFRADEINHSRLKAAFQHVADKTQILRTRFIETEDGHAQVILRPHPISWSSSTCRDADISTAAAKERKAWVSENEQELLHPFRVLFMQSPKASHFIISMHHALYDGISFDLMMEDVVSAYRGSQELASRPQFTEALPHGPLRPQEGAEVFWAKHLPKRAFQPLPADPRASGVDDKVIRQTYKNGNLLEQARRQLGVSHQAIAQACFAVALHQASSATATYGIVASGRSIPFDGADKVVGPLFNTLPVPQTLFSRWSWTDIVQHIHSLNAAIIPYQHTPLRSIKKWTGRNPDDPVFDVLFVFQHSPGSNALALPALWTSLDGEARAEYPLAFEVELDADGALTTTLVAKGEYFDTAALQTLTDHFGAALVQVAEKPGLLINDRFKIQEAGLQVGNPSAPSHKKVDLNGVHNFEWTAEAEKLRKEIAQLAGVQGNDIDEHSTIFSLGLDSIDAVKLASRLKKAGMPVPVSKLIRAQTIPRILHSVERRERASDLRQSRLATLQAQLAKSSQLQASLGPLVENVLPATPTQEALVAEMLRSDLRDYYNHDVLRISSKVDLQRLEHALQQVVHNSPILRTSFAETLDPDVDAVFAQVIHRSEAVTVDRRCLSHGDDLDSVLESIREDVKATVQTRPPTRFTLLDAGSEQYLIVSLAHAQYDGHSLALLHEDIQQAYTMAQAPTRPPADSIIEAALIATDKESMSFWKNTISGARVCHFPRRSDSSDVTLHRTELTSRVSFEAARSLCQRLSVSLQSLAQMCWAVTLAQYLKQVEVMFGVVLACRDSEEAEQVMFPTMNTAVMRASMHSTRENMLCYVQNMNNDMLPYQRTPLRSIQNACAGSVKYTDPTESGSLFDTIFLYQHRPAPVKEAPRPLYESVKGSSSVDYPVAVELEAVGNDLIVRAACKDIALDHVGTRELLETYDRVLQATVSAPEANVVDLRGSEASLCGLSPIQLRSDSREAPATVDTEYEDEIDDLGAKALAVKDALCQVARAAPEETSPSSTIESVGIDSISAIKVVALLRRQNIKLSVSQILRARTFGRIAHAATEEQDDQSRPDDAAAERTISKYLTQRNLDKLPATCGLDPQNVQAILPASAGQVYMLGAWMASGGYLFYPTFTYELESDNDLEQVRAAWEKVVSGRDILRTIFCSTNNADTPVVQAIMRKTSNYFTTDAALDHSDSLQPLVNLQATTQATGLALRLTIHHALYDAVSLPLLMEDLKAALTGSQLQPPSPTQATFLAQSVNTASQKSCRAFWTQYLQGISLARLNQPNQENPNTRVEVFKPAMIPAIATIESLARRADVTVQSVLFATYARVYAQLAHRLQGGDSHGNQDDVVLGIYLSNRSHLEGLSTLRAPTLNLVPLRVRAACNASLLECAKQIQNDLHEIGSIDNSAVGLWQIHQWTGVKVDCFVNYQKISEATIRADAGGDATIKLRDEVMFEERAKVIEVGNEGVLRTPDELQGVQKLEAYQHSVDIEATMSDGKLDMGVFCPEAMLSLEDAESVCAEAKAILLGLAA